MTTAEVHARKSVSLLSLALSVACSAAPPPPATTTPIPEHAASLAAPPAPGLVLWLTIDQLGSNVLERQRHHLPGSTIGGLIQRGLWFSEASFGHAITETAPGHATLFTGASPRLHGIVANAWFDRDKKRVIASVADDEAKLIGPGAPATAVAGSGRSPRLLRVPTLGDALLLDSGGAAHVVSISVKDRGAILPGGWGGQAYWLGPHGFVTSTYYHTVVPGWFDEHVTAHPASSYLAEAWTLALPENAYKTPPAAQPYAAGWGEKFPHRPEPGASAATLLKVAPFGDRASLDLARAALVARGLGQDDVVDLLAVSLSSLDYVGHTYGPESLEAEDAFVRIDRELSSFLDFVEARVGKERLLIVMSADHGGTETSETTSRLGLRGRRLSPSGLKQIIEAALQAKYGSKGFLSAVVSPYVVLDHDAIEAGGRVVSEVAREVKRVLEAVPGVQQARLVASPALNLDLDRRIDESLFAGRSGDLYLVPDPYTLLLQEEELGATHGSPWSNDSRVPIVLVGHGLPQGRVERPVSVASLAPTVARLLGVAPPAGARGPLLHEALAR